MIKRACAEVIALANLARDTTTVGQSTSSTYNALVPGSMVAQTDPQIVTQVRNSCRQAVLDLRTSLHLDEEPPVQVHESRVFRRSDSLDTSSTYELTTTDALNNLEQVPRSTGAAENGSFVAQQLHTTASF